MKCTGKQFEKKKEEEAAAADKEKQSNISLFAWRVNFVSVYLGVCHNYIAVIMCCYSELLRACMHLC